MVVRARDEIFRMTGSQGQEDRHLQEPEHHQERLVAHPGAHGHRDMLRLNGMTMDDVELVEFPYPGRLVRQARDARSPMNNPSELWMRRDHKHDLAFRPLETALLAGKVDAIYTQSKVFQHLQEATGKLKMIEDLSRYPDWTIQVANTPAVITCTDVMAERAPRARRRLHEGDDQGRALGQRAQARRRRHPQPPDVLPRRRGHLPGHQARRHGARA